MLSALKVICACRIEQEQSDQNKEYCLQSQEAILDKPKACEQCAHEAIKYCIACVCRSDSFGLEQVACCE